MTPKIEVEVPEDLPGRQLVIALVSGCFFEMRVAPGPFGERPRYYVNEIEVASEVYRDALETASRDEYCPDCDVEAEGSPAEPS